MILNFSVLFVIVIFLASAIGCGSNACMQSDLPDGLYIVKDPRRINATFESDRVMQRPENGYAYAIIVEIDGSYQFPLYCVKRGSAGGGAVVDDLWPVISSIGMNSQHMYIPADGWDKLIVLLNPISKLGENEWYYLEYKRDEFEKVIIPEYPENNNIKNSPNNEVFLNLIHRAENFRSKARS